MYRGNVSPNRDANINHFRDGSIYRDPNINRDLNINRDPNYNRDVNNPNRDPNNPNRDPNYFRSRAPSGYREPSFRVNRSPSPYRDPNLRTPPNPESSFPGQRMSKMRARWGKKKLNRNVFLFLVKNNVFVFFEDLFGNLTFEINTNQYKPLEILYVHIT